ncbi:Fic family protein [bacterium]|nr:Fic family protein [bacterium]
MHAYEQSHPWITFTINLSKAPAKLWVLLGECKTMCTFAADAPLLPEHRDTLVAVSLARGALAMTGIDSLSLGVDHVIQLMNGALTLPPSQMHAAQKCLNIVRGYRRILDTVTVSDTDGLNPEIIRDYNRLALDRLVLPDYIVPGEFRTAPGVSGDDQYKPPPAEDCENLIDNLCRWLESATFEAPRGMGVIYGVLKAVLAHLYMAWIRPFGDANIRTAQLMEFHILTAAGVPAPAAPLISIHFAQNRPEYKLQLEKTCSPEGKVQPFIMHAVQGFRNSLIDLTATIRTHQTETLWEHYIHNVFRDKTSPADLRRRYLALELSRISKPVPLTMLQQMLPHVALSYSKRTYKTLTRDVYDLIALGIIEKTPQGLAARKSLIQA